MTNQVTKAVIPAAGFGTRMYPATKALKKELFPIIDQDGRAKPIILAIVEEALSGGIEEVGIVVQEQDQELFHDLLKASPAANLWLKLSPENRAYSEYLQSLGDRITILTQAKQEGFGHAVFCAREWVGAEPFLLLLGDHVYSSKVKDSCARQLVKIYQQAGTSIIGITTMAADIIHKAGCVSGTWSSRPNTLNISQIVEKPTLEYAQAHLRVSGLADDQFLGVFGMYLLEPAIFDLLEAEITHNERFKGEFQLTTCLDKLRQTTGAIAYRIEGQYYDTGMPLFYRQTMIDYYRDQTLGS